MLLACGGYMKTFKNIVENSIASKNCTQKKFFFQSLTPAVFSVSNWSGREKIPNLKLSSLLYERRKKIKLYLSLAMVLNIKMENS
jgi:hypothetical protein